MTNHEKCRSKQQRAKVNRMEEMVQNTIDNARDAEFALEHADTKQQADQIKVKNEHRKESVKAAKKEIQDERERF
ncbi:small acid-soluble spore protein Tlp [Jeotgalibacillus sp. R-1-5s-1]|uniref:small acid-soluble spore protein Tlp n=1 Tax=Jeotgalibacillus sp. R-1-5s-1 TaxID=2555897 RepID=UPI001069EB2E|nr:small acid-soluble spore protein Tlp [Jeotgalibacillus sp. R-1-5s-1]TFE00789.1 small acid-soluble spore protein Tlp [Jeotgalibacillus sp. R-1-5s-1]